MFLINESFQAENKQEKNGFFFFFREDRKSYYVVNTILDMYCKEIFFIFFFIFHLTFLVR